MMNNFLREETCYTTCVAINIIRYEFDTANLPRQFAVKL